MNNEATIRMGFWTLFGMMILMRTWFSTRVRRAGERQPVMLRSSPHKSH